MKFENCARYSNWNEEDKLMQMMAALTGSASQSLQNCKEELTYAALVDRLQRRYGSEHQADSYQCQLSTRQQKSNESLQALCDDVEKLAILGYPDSPADKRESAVALPAFLRAMTDKDLSAEVWRQKPKTLRDALAEVLRAEA